MAKIYEFPNETVFYDFLAELREAYDKNLLNNFICIYSKNYKDDEEHNGFVGRNRSYWFGKSSSECLGLTDLAKEMILDYIRDANDEEE